ncbi:hypothetical protein J437_LFUL003062 [Ladona fulva]|uniref:Lipocalin/cytosolic fatty-acid binding domain-containing protein n=1 Tax=Ladona fulva TaxID=123851 RepID=A0A8K0NWV4_LADFU|nr:hypothetical protein J437_LFUL003062 [Ladona fulva]
MLVTRSIRKIEPLTTANRDKLSYLTSQFSNIYLENKARRSLSSKKEMSWVWIATFLLLRQASADSTFVDRCPSPTAVSNFTWTKYTGTWYEIESTPNALEFGGHCVRFSYKHSTGEKISYYGQLEPEISSSLEAKFRLTYLTPSGKAVKGFTSEKYWILDTDYESYSIAWSCETYQIAAVPTPRHKAWILGREKTMSMKTYAKVEAVLRNLTHIFPRYSLKETIPCSAGVVCSMNIFTLLSTLVIGGIISSR